MKPSTKNDVLMENKAGYTTTSKSLVGGQQYPVGNELQLRRISKAGNASRFEKKTRPLKAQIITDLGVLGFV